MRAIFNEDFKVVSFDPNAVADETRLEFVYDSQQNPSKATCLGIARALRIRGNFAMGLRTLIQSIDAKLSIISNEEMKMKSANQAVQDLVAAGNEAGKTEDEIIIDIVKSGVNYRDAISSYDRACIELGLKVKPLKPAERSEEVRKLLAKKKFKAPKDFDGVIETINWLLEKFEAGSVTASGLMTSLQKYCRDNEIELPKKPKEKKERISAATKITNWILDNLDADDKAFTKWAEENKISKGRVKIFMDVKNAIAKRADAEDDAGEEDSADEAA